MKATRICPKCQSRRIALIPPKSKQNHSLTYGKLISRKEKLDTYVCTRCGFTERYAQLSDKFLSWAKKNTIAPLEEDIDFV